MNGNNWHPYTIYLNRKQCVAKQGFAPESIGTCWYFWIFIMIIIQYTKEHNGIQEQKIYGATLTFGSFHDFPNDKTMNNNLFNIWGWKRFQNWHMYSKTVQKDISSSLNYEFKLNDNKYLVRKEHSRNK